MNILYLTNHLNVGGITSYVFNLAKGMKERGHNIYIASSGGELLPKFKQEGIIFVPLPIKTKSELSPKILISMYKLSHVLKRYRIEIIHSNSRTTQVLVSVLAKYKDFRHVTTCHGFFKRRITRRIFGTWGRRVIAVSQPVKEHLMRDFGVREKDITLIYNGIEAARFKHQDQNFRSEMRRNLSLADCPVVGIVGRLSDVKGHSYLIEAMQKVLQKIPQARLVIVGEGRMKKKLISLSRRKAIEKSILFIPSVKETRDILSIMDVFVMPSLKEGLGLALMEAMAAGLAVIGSDVGGIKDLVRHGVNGLLVKPADISGLASAISVLLEDVEKRRSLGQEARIFIERNFTQERMIAETENVYAECLKNLES
jgi:glycosyltransferase involved in cell wall biosynthesis